MTAPLTPAQRDRARWQQLETAQTRRAHPTHTTTPKHADYKPAQYTQDRLSDLIAWRPDLQRLAAHAGEPHTPTPERHRAPDESPIEAAIAQKNVINRIYNNLDALADEAARVLDVGTINGDRLTWLASAWTRIAKTTIAPDAATLIKTLHATAARLEGYGPEYADHKCPHCTMRGEQHTPRLERHATTQGLPLLYTCPTCGYAAIIDPAGWWNHDQATNTLEHTWRARLAEIDAWLTPKDTALILNTPYATIRSWIHRGQLERNQQGEINLRETARLKTESVEGVPENRNTTN